MDQTEARRRFEKKLVLRGYSMTGMWTKKYHDQDEKENVSSMALNGMPDTRAVLWPLDGKRGPSKWIKGGKSPGDWESDEWIAMISIAVGEDGEFPLTGDIITRWNGNVWQLSTFKSMAKRIEEIRVQVRRWDQEWAAPLADKAMMRLALSYIREGKTRKAISVLLGGLRGEVSVATVSESLSIVQLRWSHSREERLRSAKIWSSVFK